MPATHALAGFSDTSDTGWGTLLAQFPHHGARPEPLSVHSGPFRGAPSTAVMLTW